jgi:hypothetical protein
MIVNVGLPGNPRKRYLHRQSPARPGALFTQGEHSGAAVGLAMEVARQ